MVATACPGMTRSTIDWACGSVICRSGLMPMVRIRPRLHLFPSAGHTGTQPSDHLCPLDTIPLQQPNLPGTEELHPMTIIDSQVHAYDANTPKRPWHSVPNWPDHVTGDEMVAAMDKVGVDGAIFISAFSMYRYDASYAVEVQRAHPGRIAIVKPVDPDDAGVADVVADWKKTPGTVGIRIMIPKEPNRDAGRAPDDPGLDRILRAAVKY